MSAQLPRASSSPGRFQTLLGLPGTPDDHEAGWMLPRYLLVAATLAAVLFSYATRGRKSQLGIYNPKKWWELTTMRARRDFDAHGPDWIEAWFATNDKPLRFIVDSGYCTILPSSMADEFRKMKECDMYAFLAADFHAQLPGFDGFKEFTRDAHLATKVVQGHFQTQAEKYTAPLAAEASAVVADIFGENKEWHTAPVYAHGLDLVTRTIAFIMVGEELCHNPEWIQISKSHALTMAVQARELRLWPVALRPLVHWFKGASLREQVRRTRAMVEPVMAKRRAEAAACRARGVAPPEHVDAMQWFEEGARGQWYDVAGIQLAMDFAAIYSTSDLVVSALVNIARHPEVVEPLRDEIRACVGAGGGWKPASLYKMRLMDSCLKETQRCKPVECATMRSYALQDVTFADGTFVPKGDLVAVAADCMSSAAVWEDPGRWDPYRFMRMREDPETAGTAQFENTSGVHVGFGWHPRACSGRFFVAKEVKILLAYLLIRYDFKPVPGDGEVPQFRHSFSVRIHPSVQLMVRRRDEDLRV